MITVLSVSYSLAPVALDAVGGAEVVLAQIDRALVERGHRSLVVAPEGSRIRGEWISTGAAPAAIDDETRGIAIRRTRDAIQRAIQRFDVDVVHLHGLDFAEVMPPSELPILVTLHLPIAFYSSSALVAWSRRARLACVSRSQAATLPASIGPAPVVENGVDVERYRPRTGKHGYVLALGRICPEKNYPAAVDAAERAGRAIIIGGRVHGYDEHVRHFDEELAPRLGPRVRFAGPVAGARKLRLLSGAHCLLVPSTVAETSSLVSIEAMASGTPVVAYRAGALSDIVEHGRTGFIVDDVASMAEAIARVGSLDVGECRASAVRRFDARRATSRWVELLESLARRRAASEVSTGVRVEVLETLQDLAALAPEWRALHREDDRATVFQSPEWVLGCLRHLERGAPRVVVVRSGARLAGVLPLVARPDAEGLWALAGTGPSDVLDAVARAPDRAWVAEAALAHVAERRDWLALELQEIREGSALEAAARAGIAGPVAADTPLSVCPTVMIPAGVAALEDFVPGPWLRRVRRDMRACERAGLRIEIAHPPTAREHVRAWARLHALRWESRGEPGVLRGREAFAEEVLPSLLAAGLADLLSLRDRAGVLRASCVIFHERARDAYYLGGFDPEIRNRSPLVVLFAAELERAMRAGAREVDFLRGAEPYKYKWGARDRAQRRLRIERRVG